MIVLKTLEQALIDNDSIRAVIVGRYVTCHDQEHLTFRAGECLTLNKWNKSRRQDTWDNYAKWRRARQVRSFLLLEDILNRW